MNYRSIKQWPEDERPRERLLQMGAGELSASQLLAIIIRTGSREKSAMDLSRELLTHFSSLKVIEDASAAELMHIRGMGPAKISQIKAAFELGRRLLKSDGTPVQKPAFRNSREVYEYFRPRFYGLKKEKFITVLLDAKNRVFREVTVSEGTLTASIVHPREVFRHAIKEAAAAVLFVHNHPSGDPDPSRDDITITKRLVETGKVIGIHVLDHLVITDAQYTSLMERGLID